MPAIQRLPGLLHRFAGVSPEGSVVQVSIWDSEEPAKQMAGWKEMFVRPCADLSAAGVESTPEHALIVNYPIIWTARRMALPRSRRHARSDVTARVRPT